MDPFEVLGVARDATAEQVEARWRQLAWQLHPDQHPEAGDAERARLTAAMAELNEARRVVLAVLSQPAAAAASGPGAPSPGAPAAPPRRAPAPEPPPPGAAWFVIGTVAGVVLLLMVVVVVVVLATSDDRPAAGTVPATSVQTVVPTGPPTTLFVEWAIGSCISAGELVVPVDCGASNAGRIVLRTTAPEFCPDWAEAFVRVDADVWCVDENA
jgi:hypothetical protein